MATVLPLSDAEVAYLDPFMPQHNPAKSDRPHVTLTYASGLDGLISINPSTRTIISGNETKSMTHYLRLKHDTILVGWRTAVYDDPKLNCRYPGARFADQPQPVIVDSSRRWDADNSQLVQLNQHDVGKRPWIITRLDADSPSAADTLFDVLPVASDHARLDWSAILSTLKAAGVESVMIEGGAAIINGLLKHPDLVDSVIVTIAPTWLGLEVDSKGAHVSPSRSIADGASNAARLGHVAWRQFGNDMVLCGRLQTKPAP